MDPLILKVEIQKLFDRYYMLPLNVDDFFEFELFEKSLINFESDFRRYFQEKSVSIELVYSRIELIGIMLYRLSREYFLQNNELISNHLSNLGRIISGFEIYYSADIGLGLKINHGLGTVIGARCVIGKNALIHQNVTFGDKNGKRPILLDNVTVYAGAKVLGGVVCGNNSTIAANCVCMIDVPDNCIIMGVPGKIK